jgi:hypothetical protein
MATEDLSLLTDDEKSALVALLKRAIDGDRFTSPYFAARTPARRKSFDKISEMTLRA